MLPHTGSKLKVALWAFGTPEQFILHVSSAIHACNQIEIGVKFSRAKEAVANAILNLEMMRDEYAQVCGMENRGKRKQRRMPPSP